MRVAVISDTHLYTEEQVMDRLWSHLYGFDLIIHAGDVVESVVVETIEKLAPVVGVAGNMDGQSVRWMWPTRRIMHLGVFRIGLIHGEGPPEGLWYRAKRSFGDHPDLDMIIFGHSHIPEIMDAGDMLVVNPGSITRPEVGGPTMLVFDPDGPRLVPEIVHV